MLKTTRRLQFIRGEEERLDGGLVRGWMLAAHMLWLRTYFGSTAEIELLSSLGTEPAAGLARGLQEGAWYPFAWLIAVDRGIYELIGEGIDESSLYEDLGRFSARRHLGNGFSPWNGSQLHEFFASATDLHSCYQDFGTVEYLRLEERRVQMIHSGSHCRSTVYCASAVGYYEQCLISHGAFGFSVTEETCQCQGWDKCKFDLRWKGSAK